MPWPSVHSAIRPYGSRCGSVAVPLSARTRATAITIGAPVSWKKAGRAVDWSDGWVTSVDEQDIADAKAIIGAEGIGCEPASATTLAAIRRSGRDRGLMTVVTDLVDLKGIEELSGIVATVSGSVSQLWRKALLIERFKWRKHGLYSRGESDARPVLILVVLLIVFRHALPHGQMGVDCSDCMFAALEEV